MAIGVFLLWCGVCGAADRPWTEVYPEEADAANKSCTAKEYGQCREHLMRLRALLDGRADIVYRLAKVEAMLGNRAAALDWLKIYSQSGLTFADPAGEPAFAPLMESADFKVILSRLKLAQEPVSTSWPFVTLAENDLVPEDIAYDPVTRRFYVSSVRHRKILSVTMDGKAGEFLPEGQPGIWAVMALAVDAKRRYLWASTAAMPEAIGARTDEEGRSALLKFSLASGALVKRYDLPTDTRHALGDMTVSRGGDVFVSDGYGEVYRVDHSRDTLEVLVGKGAFGSPQTPALTSDGRRLFVPDYSRGIGIVDLATRQIKLVEHPAELSLAGIDGLYLSGRTMVAIQNGTGPERLIRMQLDRGLTRILKWQTLEANWAGLGDPTHGAVVGRRFYFIANSGWDKLGDNGALKPGATFTAGAIREMPLNGKPRRTTAGTTSR